jgi:tetratricopeptide (TPR) repeat protein
MLVIALVGGGTLAWWPRSSRPDRDPKRLRLLQAAWKEFDAGRFERANAILDRRAREIAPTSLDWMLRARVAEGQGKLQEALDHLEHIPETDAIAPQAWLKVAQIERSRHRLRAAEAAYLRALKLNPKQIQSHRELIYIYTLQHRKRDCDAECRILSRLIDFDHVLAFAWAQNDCDVFDPKEAIPVLEPIVQADPGDRWSRLALANDYRLTRQYDLAEAILEALPDSDPDARAIRVQITLVRGDRELAARLLREAPTDHPRLNCLRGQLALQEGDAVRAAALFEAVIDQEPRDRDAIHGLGTALQQLHDPRAQDYVLTALRVDQMTRLIVDCGALQRIDVKVFSRLGEICESVGQRDQARVWYELAILWDGPNNQANEGLARIRRADEQPSGESASLPDQAH